MAFSFLSSFIDGSGKKLAVIVEYSDKLSKIGLMNFIAVVFHKMLQKRFVENRSKLNSRSLLRDQQRGDEILESVT